MLPGRELVGVAAVARGPDEALGGREAERDARVDLAVAVDLDVGLEARPLLVDDHRVREADRRGLSGSRRRRSTEHQHHQRRRDPANDNPPTGIPHDSLPAARLDPSDRTSSGGKERR